MSLRVHQTPLIWRTVPSLESFHAFIHRSGWIGNVPANVGSFPATVITAAKLVTLPNVAALATAMLMAGGIVSLLPSHKSKTPLTNANRQYSHLSVEQLPCCRRLATREARPLPLCAESRNTGIIFRRSRLRSGTIYFFNLLEHTHVPPNIADRS